MDGGLPALPQDWDADQDVFLAWGVIEGGKLMSPSPSVHCSLQPATDRASSVGIQSSPS